MKTTIPFILALATTAAGCGKLFDSAFQSSSDPAGTPGFMFANAIFLDGTANCNGNAGATINFSPLMYRQELESIADPESVGGLEGFNVSACTGSRNELASSQSAEALPNSESANDADSKIPNSVETAADRFAALCNERIASKRGGTIFAIARLAGMSDIPDGNSNNVSLPVATGAPMLADGDTASALPQNGSATQTPSPSAGSGDFCHTLYEQARSMRTLDLSSQNPGIVDIEPLKFMYSLRSLNLSNNPIQTAVSISGLRLETLVMDNVPLSSESTVFTWK